MKDFRLKFVVALGLLRVGADPGRTSQVVTARFPGPDPTHRHTKAVCLANHGDVSRNKVSTYSMMRSREIKRIHLLRYPPLLEEYRIQRRADQRGLRVILKTDDPHSPTAHGRYEQYYR